MREFRTEIDGLDVGAAVTVEAFAEGDRVDVSATSKGHGFAGGIKRHNFSGGGASHGSMIHRQPGSNGDTNAGHTSSGSRRPGHYGVDTITHQNLEIVRADTERNLLLVRGPVPGPKNGLVIVTQSSRSRKAPDAASHRRQGQGPRSTAVPEAFAGDVYGKPTRSSARSSASWPTRAPVRTRRSSATKSAAAAASPGSKRAPAARAKVRSARRSGVTAASCSARSRAATSARSTRKSARPRLPPRSPTSSRTVRSRCSIPTARRLTRPRISRRCCSASPKAAKTGVRTLVVFAESELGASVSACGAPATTFATLGVTHTGALDIKDVVGYTRLVLTQPRPTTR